MLQAQQIVALATQIAKVPGYTSQAGQLLNSILAELCHTYDFDLARKSTAFNFTGSAGPYDLPADYLRSSPRDVFFTIQVGLPYFMVWADKAEYDRFIKQTTLSSYPTRYWTDMSKVYDASTNPNSVPQMYVWPPPSGAYPVTVAYFSLMADITTPETSTTVPWFPMQSYLIQRLAGELMKLSGDQRCGQFLGDSDGTDGQIEGCQSILRKYLMLKDDADNSIKRVELDRRYFSGTSAWLPESKQIDWGGAT